MPIKKIKTKKDLPWVSKERYVSLGFFPSLTFLGKVAVGLVIVGNVVVVLFAYSCLIKSLVTERSLSDSLESSERIIQGNPGKVF